MPSEVEIESRFWKELKASPFMMLGLDGANDGHVQPMTARFDGDGDGGPLWFFVAKDTKIVAALDRSHRAIASYTAKGHDLFATVHGELSLVDDRAMIDRLWDKQVEAWFGSRDNPNVALLRLDTERAEIWLTTSTGTVSRLFGGDAQAKAQDRVAEVSL